MTEGREDDEVEQLRRKVEMYRELYQAERRQRLELERENEELRDANFGLRQRAPAQ